MVYVLAKGKCNHPKLESIIREAATTYAYRERLSMDLNCFEVTSFIPGGRVKKLLNRLMRRKPPEMSGAGVLTRDDLGELRALQALKEHLNLTNSTFPTDVIAMRANGYKKAPVIKLNLEDIK